MVGDLLCGGDAFEGKTFYREFDDGGFSYFATDKDCGCQGCARSEAQGGKCGPIPAALPADMKRGNIYRGSDGRWYRHDGTLVSRAARRKAGVR